MAKVAVCGGVLAIGAALSWLVSCTEHVSPTRASRIVGTDANCDGIPEGPCRVSYPAAHGLGSSGGGTDADCDGTPDTACYDYVEQSTQPRWRGFDDDCDGRYDRECVLAFDVTRDGDTEHAAIEIDRDCDGIADRCESTTTGPFFVLIERRIDDGCDGVFEQCRIGGSEANGWTSGLDDNCDGIADSQCHTVIRDDDGPPVVSRTDDDCDGVPESCRARAAGTQGAASIGDDDDCDGIADRNCSLSMRDGDLSVSGVDEDCDGTLDHSCRRAWSEGDTLRTGMDVDCDGTVDTDCWTHTITPSATDGARPTKIRTAQDNNCDGTPDTCTVELSHGAP